MKHDLQSGLMRADHPFDDSANIYHWASNLIQVKGLDGGSGGWVLYWADPHSSGSFYSNGMSIYQMQMSTVFYNSGDAYNLKSELTNRIAMSVQGFISMQKNLYPSKYL